MLLMKDIQLASEVTKPGDKTVALVVLGSYHPVTSGAWVEEGNYVGSDIWWHECMSLHLSCFFGGCLKFLIEQ